MPPGAGPGCPQSEGSQLPKCLLNFGGMTLLERHLRLLQAPASRKSCWRLGFEHELVEAELARLAALGRRRRDLHQ